MASLPYIQFFPADYLADTGHLSTVEHGAYLLLIMTYWQRGESFRAKDDQALNDRLAKISRLSPDQWQEVRETLAEFFETSPTEWRHGRIEKDLAGVKEKSLSNQANGKRGAESRWKNNSQAIARPSAKHSQAIARPSKVDGETMAISDVREDTETEKKEEYPPTPLAGGESEEAPEPHQLYSQEFEALWSAYPRKIGKGQAWTTWQKLKRQKVFPGLEAVIKAVEAQARSPSWRDPKYIPHLSTWLNGHRWLDETTAAQESQKERNIKALQEWTPPKRQSCD